MVFSSMRVGEKYKLINYGESYRFKLLEVLSSKDYLVEDLLTMEKYKISKLIAYGKGNDFELIEL